MDLSKEIISWIGVALSLMGFNYQAIKTIKNKNTEGLSVITFSVIYLGTFLWLLFSLFAGVMQTCVVNVFVAIPTAIILFLIYKNNHCNNEINAYLLLFVLLLIPIALGVVTLTNEYGNEFIGVSSNSLNLCLSFASGIVGAGSFVPQLIKTIRFKHTKDLSYGLMVTNGVAQIFWAGFWFMSAPSEDLGTWLAGAIFATVLGAIQWAIVFLKYRYEKQELAK